MTNDDPIERLLATIARVREVAENLVARGQGHGAAPTQSDRTRGTAAEEILAVLNDQEKPPPAADEVDDARQLARLPFLSIVREKFGPSPGSGNDYGGVWERRTSGWHPLAGSVMPPGYATPRLPVRILYVPDEPGARR